MEGYKYCRGCLVIDVKIFNMDWSLCEVYTKLLGIRLLNQQNYLCYECTSLLNKYHEFYTKCHQSNDILRCLFDKNTLITKETIINHRLKSRLDISKTVTYDSVTNNIKSDDGIINDEQIKQEVNSNPVDSIETNLEDIEDKPMFNVDKCKKRKTTNIKNLKLKLKKKIKTEFDNDNTIDDYSDLDNEPLAKSIVKLNIDPNINPIKNKKKRTKFDVTQFEDYARVVFLSREDAFKEVLLRKESSNYKNCQFKCDLCYRGFDAQSAFDNHARKHSEENGMYECELCHLRFRNQMFLCRHRHSTHNRKFYCKICPYICFSTYQAKTHISLHQGKKYPCKDCGKQFSMPNSLLMHRRNKHAAECVCELCGSTFSTDRGLETHKLIIHRQEKNEENGPSCDDCGVRFSTETAWKRHLVLSTKHDVSNGCEQCGETFHISADLKRHAKVHTDKQTKSSDYVKLPATCTHCDRWLVTRIEYKYHMLADHPQSDAAQKMKCTDNNQWICEICGKSFKKQCFLQNHIRVHTGDRQVHRCSACGEGFARPVALRKHYATAHEGQMVAKRTERCHLCNKTFAFRSALNKHVKAHLGIRPHKCAICDKSFPNLCDVKTHVKYVHCKEPWPKRDRTKRKVTKEPPID